MNKKNQLLYDELMKDNVLIEDNLFAIIDELKLIKDFDQHSHYHDLTVLDHSTLAINLSPRCFYIRLALLLHDIGKPTCHTIDAEGFYHYKGHGDESYKISKVILKRLNLPLNDIEYITKLIKLHDKKIPLNNDEFKIFYTLNGKKFTKDLITLRIADIKAHNDYCIKLNETYVIKLMDYLSLL